jgi:hypothetical protein
MYTPNHRRYAVFVPVSTNPPNFDPRSAIVAPDDPDAIDRSGRLVVWLESNRYNSRDLNRFVARVHHAAGRCDQRYPTIAKQSVDATELKMVATYDLQDGELTVTDAASLAHWLDGEAYTTLFDEHREAKALADDLRAGGERAERARAKIVGRTDP